jgi:hypothetical protein
MPFYKQKPFRVEAIQVTAENISNVFQWVSQSNAINAHSLTSNSFVLVYLSNPPENVSVGDWVMKRTNDSFGIIPAGRLEERWQEVTAEEANTLPQINRQQKSFQEVNWVRFSELIF